MKSYVIDASTSLKWIFDDEENVDFARSLLLKYLENKILLVAPSLWLVETANAIKSSILSKRVSKKQGSKLLSLILKAKPKIVPFDAYVEPSLANAVKYVISVYDSIYLTIALENEVPMITSDEKLYSKVKGLKGRVVLLKDFKSRW